MLRKVRHPFVPCPHNSRTTPGRIVRQSPKAAPGGNPATAQLRLNRRNNAKQAQAKKRASIVSATRLFNGADGAPRIVAIIPLSEDVQASSAARAVAAALDVSPEDCPQHGLWKIR
jgi:pre-rRNA-processing protein TSR1